jgi:hypothetical protein
LKIDIETLRILLMAASTLIAVLSYRNTVKLWKKTNRPIVSAFVETESSGNIATTYDLLVINSGNRPAVDIQLQLNIEDLKQCITPPINDPKIELILKCFNNDGVIPLLVAGAKISNSFGLTSRKPEDNVWKYGSSLPIKIIYKDLEGDQWYTSALTLVVKDSNTFAGTQWVKEKYKREDVVKLLQEILDSLKKS